MEELKSTYPLIHNKVTSPRYVTPTLRRARLVDWLSANAEARAVVIAADAGYGKTTLLWQWEREVDFPCYWYKLDRNDRDWTLHISYLVEAISQHYPGFGRRAHSVLRQMGGPGSSRPGVAAYLLAEMHEKLREPCTIIIDDWQFVAAVTEVRGLWNQILRDAPPSCRFVFASRGKPHLQFARFKTHGGYAELRTDDLRMTEAEIAELFRDVYRDPLTADEAAELERRTEGWAASLQLVEVSLRERRTPEERRALIESLTATSDSDLFAFLAEEVLEQQPEETRNFLLSTSILHQITPEVAERLAGVHDGTRRLMQLEHTGLFTYRLDESRFRYHGLFREFLEHRLADERSDAEVMGLHIHAASYFETSSQWPEAIYHYLKAGLQRQAARLIARYGEDVVAEGRLGMVDEWLQQLPAKTIRDNARLSLLHGEALGIGGNWEAALTALERAREFFAKKQDKRMEALALVKESSVYHYWGRPEIASETAKAGLAAAPADARDLRLRLEGNLAITSLWLHEPLERALNAVMRVTAEASQMGLEHYAAIGMHNLGTLQLEMGQVERSIKSHERAAAFWDQLPANPFADNYNLVRSHLAASNTHRALELSRRGESRTKGWPRSHAEALSGLALASAQAGEFEVAFEVLRPLVLGAADYGQVAESARVHFLEVAAQADQVGEEARRIAEDLRRQPQDPRLDVSREAILAVVDHRLSRCGADCGRDASNVIEAWAKRGARYQAATGLVWIAPLGLNHGRPAASREAVHAVNLARQLGILRSLRSWLRPFAPHISGIAGEGDIGVITALIDAEPDFWIPYVCRDVLGSLTADHRAAVLSTIERHSGGETLKSLASASGADVAALRFRLIQRQAPRLYIRTFGGLSIHRDTWAGRPIDVSKRRTRSLLALLAAHITESLSRDEILDTLWPDADPAAAVNSLNQTLFQLRRALDAEYKDGSSPQYVVSSADAINLNDRLVRFDWVEILRKSGSLESLNQKVSEVYTDFVAEIVRGEFLAESRYEDWSQGPRRRVHEQVRQALLPAAQDAARNPHQRLQLAQAVIAIDPYDEAGAAALARALLDGGRRAASRAVVKEFIQRLRDDFDEEPAAGWLEKAGAAGIKI
jgi:ATP/maltotriose-dependent transcriptional regulator MalT/DNA-binding SARP family transcriptional activator